MHHEFCLPLELKSPISWSLATWTPLGPVKGISVPFIKYKSIQVCITWAQVSTFCSPQAGNHPQDFTPGFPKYSGESYCHYYNPFLFQPQHTTCQKNGVNNLLSCIRYLNVNSSRVGAIPESFRKIREAFRWVWRTRIPRRPFQSFVSWPNEPSELLKGHKSFVLSSSQNYLRKTDWAALKNPPCGTLSWKHTITRELDLPEVKRNFASFFFLRKHYKHTQCLSFDTHSNREVNITSSSLPQKKKNFFFNFRGVIWESTLEK